MEHAIPSVWILMGLFVLFILGNIFKARRGRELFIRRIAGLSAIDEAIGRATEMGRPMLFSPGLDPLTLSTFAALGVLSYISQLAARYETKLLVPINVPEVFPVAEEVCRQAYMREGKLDAFNPEDVRYITSDQFGYASGVIGMMHRERTASNFLFGYFYAESLILAEAGQHTGALQVAGTDAALQVPFFITATDYTIIGEELYAASAYLTKEPIMLGSLVGQDFSKIVLLAVIVLGVITVLILGEKNWFVQLFQAVR